MTAPVPTIEPREARAGDTWIWAREDLTDYPATAWDLKYAFKNASNHFEITAAANGANFLVTASMTATASYAAGIFSWVAYVESGSQRFEVARGTLRVLPKYTGTDAVDDRTHARKVLEAIEAVIENRATLDQQEYTIGDRNLKRMAIGDLMRLRAYYRSLVRGEEGGSTRLVARL